MDNNFSLNNYSSNVFISPFFSILIEIDVTHYVKFFLVIEFKRANIRVIKMQTCQMTFVDHFIL